MLPPSKSVHVLFLHVQALVVTCDLPSDIFSTALSPIPKPGRCFWSASLNLGWLMAYTIGLKQEQVLARKDGICDTRGVIKDRFPNCPISTTDAYGVQAQIQRRTFVSATLAIFISALSSLLFPSLRRLSTFIFFAWAFIPASWAQTAFTMKE